MWVVVLFWVGGGGVGGGLWGWFFGGLGKIADYVGFSPRRATKRTFGGVVMTNLRLGLDVNRKNGCGNDGTQPAQKLLCTMFKMPGT